MCNRNVSFETFLEKRNPYYTFHWTQFLRTFQLFKKKKKNDDPETDELEFSKLRADSLWKLNI